MVSSSEWNSRTTENLKTNPVIETIKMKRITGVMQTIKPAKAQTPNNQLLKKTKKRKKKRWKIGKQHTR